MGTTFRPSKDLDQRRKAEQRDLARRAALTNLPPAPILAALVACLALRLLALALDSEHRWWLPITLIQRSSHGLIGDAMIVAPLFAAANLLRRMIRANEWEDLFVLGIAVICHLQLVLPWGREDGLHQLVTFGALTAYAWLLCQAGYRHGSPRLGLFGAGMLILTWAAACALQFDYFRTFGVLEHLLLFGLLLGFWQYDREHVAAALVRESSPKTCRENNIRPPYL